MSTVPDSTDFPFLNQVVFIPIGSADMADRPWSSLSLGNHDADMDWTCSPGAAGMEESDADMGPMDSLLSVVTQSLPDHDEQDHFLPHLPLFSTTAATHTTEEEIQEIRLLREAIGDYWYLKCADELSTTDTSDWTPNLHSITLTEDDDDQGDDEEFYMWDISGGRGKSYSSRTRLDPVVPFETLEVKALRHQLWKESLKPDLFRPQCC